MFRPMYETLTTNLPVEIMEIDENHPFDVNDGPSFVSHDGVYRYLASFAEHNELLPLIRFGRHVESITRRELGWGVQSSSATDNGPEEDTFDYVIICNGHFSTPYIPSIDGVECFNRKGSSMHAIQFDTNQARPQIFLFERTKKKETNFFLFSRELDTQFYW